MNQKSKNRQKRERISIYEIVLIISVLETIVIGILFGLLARSLFN